MTKDNNRVDGKSVVTGPPIVLPKNSPDRVFLKKTIGIDIEEGSKSNVANPFFTGSGSGGGGNPPEDPNPLVAISDIPQLSDIENITYQQYFDTFNSIRIKAIIKIRNSSKNKANVIGVDARSQQSNQAPALSVPNPVGFITPSPSIPSVKFNRVGTAIAWGWNNVSGLGSYSNVYYDWQIRSNSGTTGTVLNSGRKNYVSDSTSLQVGTSGVYKNYRVSSSQGDTAATASARWLRVVVVVIGTDGKTYTSSYSTPI